MFKLFILICIILIIKIFIIYYMGNNYSLSNPEEKLQNVNKQIETFKNHLKNTIKNEEIYRQTIVHNLQEESYVNNTNIIVKYNSLTNLVDKCYIKFNNNNKILLLDDIKQITNQQNIKLNEMKQRFNKQVVLLEIKLNENIKNLKYKYQLIREEILYKNYNNIDNIKINRNSDYVNFENKKIKEINLNNSNLKKLSNETINESNEKIKKLTNDITKKINFLLKFKKRLIKKIKEKED